MALDPREFLAVLPALGLHRLTTFTRTLAGVVHGADRSEVLQAVIVTAADVVDLGCGVEAQRPVRELVLTHVPIAPEHLAADVLPIGGEALTPGAV